MNGGEIFLVEAKAHLSELISSPSQAKSATSIELIKKSLDETKSYLHISLDKDWASKYYQYTNRLAHLYFLRVKNNVPAYLVFLYLVRGCGSERSPNERGVAERHPERCVKFWESKKITRWQNMCWNFLSIWT